MERLVVNIPEKKSTLVKQILKGLGVTIQNDTPIPASNYRQKLSKVSIWTDDDIKSFEENKKALESFKPQQW